MSTNTILASAPLTSTGYHLKANGTTLGNSLIWDNGTNVGIGNTNTTYNFDVTGTGRFTSTLLVSGIATFGSTISNGTYTYTLPSATGTLALVGGSGVGTVTSVGLSSATSGVTIGSTPVTTSGTITIDIATATTSQNGLLSSTDWTTFNNKGNGTVTGVTGTAPVVSSGGATPAISMAAATASVNGYLTSANFTTFNNKFTLPSLTSGSVLFSNGSTIAQDNSNFYWDDTNNRLGLGTNTPSVELHVKSASTTVQSYVETTSSSGRILMQAQTPLRFIGLRCYQNFSETLFGINTVDATFLMSSTGSPGMVMGTISNSPISFGTNNTIKATITSGGQVIVGGTTSAAGTPRFQVEASTGNNALIAGFNFNGTANNSINCLINVGSYVNTSSQTVATQGAANGTASSMQFYNGGFYWYGNTGLTNGVVYTNTQRMFLSSAGALAVSGALTKGSGAFKITHPLPSMSETHYLVHSFIEGPQADLIYRGRITLVNGKGQANIDEVSVMTEGTFEVLCRDVQCFTTNESGWDLIKGHVIGNIIYIESNNQNSTDEISWMVIGERKDKHMLDNTTEWTDDNGKIITEPLIIKEDRGIDYGL